MKTKIIKNHQGAPDEHLIIDPPYIVFGHTTISPSFSTTMKVGGLRQMIQDLDDEDSFKITIYHEKDVEYSFFKNRQYFE